MHLRSDRHRLAKVVLRKLTRCHRDPVGMLCVEEDTSGIHIHTYTHTHTQSYTHARTHTHTHTHTHTGPGQLSGGQRHAPAADSGVERFLYRMCSLQNVFSVECVIYRMCSLQNVFPAECVPLTPQRRAMPRDVWQHQY